MVFIFISSYEDVVLSVFFIAVSEKYVFLVGNAFRISLYCGLLSSLNKNQAIQYSGSIMAGLEP